MKKIGSSRQKNVPKNANARADGDSFVLVGTYRDKQLADYFPEFKEFMKKDIPFLPDKNPSFTFIDLFAGIGGLRIAMQNCGGKCVFTSELKINTKGKLKWRQSA